MNELEIKIKEEVKKCLIENKDIKTTGAACFTSIGFATCSDGITEAQASRIASNLNVSYRFYSGKSCSEITCR